MENDTEVSSTGRVSTEVSSTGRTGTEYTRRQKVILIATLVALFFSFSVLSIAAPFLPQMVISYINNNCYKYIIIIYTEQIYYGNYVKIAKDELMVT